MEYNNDPASDNNEIIRRIVLALIKQTKYHCIDRNKFAELLRGVIARKDLVITIRDSWVDICGVLKVKLDKTNTAQFAGDVLRDIRMEFVRYHKNLEYNQETRKEVLRIHTSDAMSLLGKKLNQANDPKNRLNLLITGEDGKVVVDTFRDKGVTRIPKPIPNFTISTRG